MNNRVGSIALLVTYEVELILRSPRVLDMKKPRVDNDNTGEDTLQKINKYMNTFGKYY